MKRMAEMVLPGHPDKFCDQLADSIVAEAVKIQKNAYAQIEIAVWSDVVWLNGAVVTEKPFEKKLNDIVIETGLDIGYTKENHIDAEKYKVVSEICFINDVPDKWGRYINDQSIVIGWAGYDEKTHFLAPEHFLVNFIRDELINEYTNGKLKGLGPDGKILAIIEEKENTFKVLNLILSIQNKGDENYIDLIEIGNDVLEKTLEKIQNNDKRWVLDKSIKIYINPAGNFVNAGSDGDNGQTGRKLVIDFYGPRIPIGGGALSGKHIGHIDRLAAYAARQAAIKAVKSGAKECFIRLAYSPMIAKPLSVEYLMKGRGVKQKEEFFEYENMLSRYSPDFISAKLAQGRHFYDLSLPWNQ